MKKGQMCEGVIEYIDFPNKGRVKVEDQYVTVKNGIPGQKIRFVINKRPLRRQITGSTGEISIRNH